MSTDIDSDQRFNFRIVTEEDDQRTVEWLECASFTQLLQHGASLERFATVISVTVVGPKPFWQLTYETVRSGIEVTVRIEARSLAGAIARFREEHAAADYEILEVAKVG